MGSFESRTFCAVGRLVQGTFSDSILSDGMFLEWDVSRAGPFVCAPNMHVYYI
jgi:hypothetical protein